MCSEKFRGGKKMFSGKTASDGMLTIKDFKIPYVAKGTLPLRGVGFRRGSQQHLLVQPPMTWALIP